MLYLTQTTKKGIALPRLYGYMYSLAGLKRTRVLDEHPHHPFAVDNGAAAGQFHPEKYLKLLEKLAPYQDRALFAVAPDVMRDPAATLELYPEWKDAIRALGYPVAFVAQPGLQPHELPDADWIFLGGGNQGDYRWRFTDDAKRIVDAAQQRGMRVHIGMVNAQWMIRQAQAWGVDTVDGNCAAIAGLEEMLRRFTKVLEQPSIFTPVP